MNVLKESEKIDFIITDNDFWLFYMKNTDQRTFNYDPKNGRKCRPGDLGRGLQNIERGPRVFAPADK